MRVEMALSEAHFVDRIRATAFDEAVARSHRVTRWPPLMWRTGRRFRGIEVAVELGCSAASGWVRGAAEVSAIAASVGTVAASLGFV